MSLWPTDRLLHAAAGLLGLAVVVAFAPALGALQVTAFGLLVLAAVIDLALPGWREALDVSRSVPDNVAQGVPFEASLSFENPGSRPRRFEVFEGLPLETTSADFPRLVEAGPGESVRVPYAMTAHRRGGLPFRELEILCHSRLGLWRRRHRIAREGTLRVLPNHRPVVKFHLLAIAHQLEQSGVRRRARRGNGTSFHQLRDYRDGDLPQQIDWKATSRRRQVISREYEEERDQRIVLLVDRGRRMSVSDGQSSLLDHALNAALLLSFVALGQGDRVGLVGFSGEPSWIPSVKGPGGMPRILFGVHDWQATSAPSDYFEAARRAMILERRRALVVVLTTLRGEDSKELVRAIDAMCKRHLVIVASLREPAVAALAETSPRDLQEAIASAGAQEYEASRDALAAELRGRGVRVIDVLPDDLPSELASAYLDEKAAGRL